ncbi:MAG: hypothetical protein O6834_00875 [Actinobacteria bacterium]|nr:hypothetical protein [Actinomycetota bacterium]MCZ6739261.1 hypothetical protein [Actinomycetota bacterium]
MSDQAGYRINLSERDDLGGHEEIIVLTVTIEESLLACLRTIRQRVARMSMDASI